MIKIAMLTINGIEVYREHGHLLLQKNGIQMRCDVGELNAAIPEFEEYYDRKINLIKV